MVATRSAKRSGAKKRAQPKRAASRKKTVKARAKRRSKKKTGSMVTGLQRKARKGLKAAKQGLDSVIKAGEKRWKMLKTRTKS